MKKALAIVMALVIALSMSAMAFATTTTKALTETCGNCGSIFESAEQLREHIASDCEGTHNTCPNCLETFADEDAYNAHLKVCNIKACPKCEREFADEAVYNDHIAICTYGDEKDYVDLTVKEILTMIIDLVKTNATQWDAIESVVIRLVDFIENIGSGLIPAADVEGAVADLEASLAGIEIPGVEDLLNQLKSKIKAMYAGEKATTVATTIEETTTEAATTPETGSTGSATVGIAAFAAVSVAAAAAYVCTKKKA